MRNVLALPLLFGTALLAASLPAQAQTSYPSRSIHVIVPLQTGSAADVATRIVLGKVGENMKTSFVIENLAGASGLPGAERLARAAPDGYTLGGVTDSVLNYAANLAEKLNFDPVKDFQPISQMAKISWVLVANQSSGITTLSELMDRARKQPGKIDYASGGVGSPHHIAMELFSRSSGIQLTHVPYKGATQATIDVAGGHVPVMFSAVSVALPHITDGKVRALAQPNDQRSAQLPQVPTFGEAGAAAFQFSTWLGLYAPKNTPAPIVERLNKEVAAALADTGVRQRLMDLGLEPAASSPDQLGELTRAGYERVGKAIRDAGIKKQ